MHRIWTELIRLTALTRIYIFVITHSCIRPRCWICGIIPFFRSNRLRKANQTLMPLRPRFKHNALNAHPFLRPQPLTADPESDPDPDPSLYATLTLRTLPPSLTLHLALTVAQPIPLTLTLTIRPQSTTPSDPSKGFTASTACPTETKDEKVHKATSGGKKLKYRVLRYFSTKGTPIPTIYPKMDSGAADGRSWRGDASGPG